MNAKHRKLWGIALAFCILCPLSECFLRVAYGYGVPTTAYVWLGAAHMFVLGVTSLVTFTATALLAATLAKGESTWRHLVLLVCAILALLLTAFAFLHSPAGKRQGARVRIVHLGSDAYVEKLREDAAQLIAEGLRSQDKHNSGEIPIIPPSFFDLGVSLVRVSLQTEPPYVSIHSDRPHRSRWCIVPTGDGPLKSGVCVTEGIYRQ